MDEISHSTLRLRLSLADCFLASSICSVFAWCLSRTAWDPRLRLPYVVGKISAIVSQHAAVDQTAPVMQTTGGIIRRQLC